jgi:hypothetical protein
MDPALADIEQGSGVEMVRTNGVTAEVSVQSNESLVKLRSVSVSHRHESGAVLSFLRPPPSRGELEGVESGVDSYPASDARGFHHAVRALYGPPPPRPVVWKNALLIHVCVCTVVLPLGGSGALAQIPLPLPAVLVCAMLDLRWSGWDLLLPPLLAQSLMHKLPRFHPASTTLSLCRLSLCLRSCR